MLAIHALRLLSFRVQFNRLLQVLDCPLLIALEVTHPPTLALSLGKSRFILDQAVEIGQRLIQLTLLS